PIRTFPSLSAETARFALSAFKSGGPTVETGAFGIGPAARNFLPTRFMGGLVSLLPPTPLFVTVALTAKPNALFLTFSPSRASGVSLALDHPRPVSLYPSASRQRFADPLGAFVWLGPRSVDGGAGLAGAFAPDTADKLELVVGGADGRLGVGVLAPCVLD